MMNFLVILSLHYLDANGPVRPLALWPFPQSYYPDIPETAAKYNILFTGNVNDGRRLYDFTR